jgi:hypothetical protein
MKQRPLEIFVHPSETVDRMQRSDETGHRVTESHDNKDTTRPTVPSTIGSTVGTGLRKASCPYFSGLARLQCGGLV